MRTTCSNLTRGGLLCAVLVLLVAWLVPGCGMPCETAAECDDGDPCTIDRCDDGNCANAPIDCFEGEECVSGECMAGGPPVAPGTYQGESTCTTTSVVAGEETTSMTTFNRTVVIGPNGLPVIQGREIQVGDAKVNITGGFELQLTVVAIAEDAQGVTISCEGSGEVPPASMITAQSTDMYLSRDDGGLELTGMQEITTSTVGPDGSAIVVESTASCEGTLYSTAP